MENISKNPRGRPKSVLGLMHDWLDREFPGRSDRTLWNKGSMFTARLALGNGDEPEFAYLVGKGQARSRTVILAELGRLEDKDSIRRLASTICTGQMKTSVAVAYLRGLRGAQKRATEGGLQKRLAAAVDEWMLQEGATLSIAVAALRNVQAIVEKLISESS